MEWMLEERLGCGKVAQWIGAAGIGSEWPRHRCGDECGEVQIEEAANLLEPEGQLGYNGEVKIDAR
jgi:hypothetical protein